MGDTGIKSGLIVSWASDALDIQVHVYTRLDQGTDDAVWTPSCCGIPVRVVNEKTQDLNYKCLLCGGNISSRTSRQPNMRKI